MAQIMATVAAEGVLGTEPPVDVDARATRFRDQIDDPGVGASWVLELGGDLVGHAGTREAVPGVFGFGIAILPAGRGHGGGRALLNAIIDHARATGAHKIELEVWPDNARAIALYVSCGFEFEGLRRGHYRRRDGSLRSAVLMALLL